MNNHRPTPTTPVRSARRRLGVLTASGAALAAGGLVAVLAIGGAANAQQARDTPPPNLDDFLPAEDDPPTPTIAINPAITGPTIAIPEGPGGPIVTGPIISIPTGPDGPIITIPAGPTMPNFPDDTLAPGDTTGPDDTAAPVDTPAPADTVAPAPPETPAPPASAAPGSDDVPPFLVITSATVDCAGALHVTYETGALPEPAPDTEHVVMFSPASNPAAVTAHRLLQRPVNGVFTVDMQSPVAEQYRVFVIADFEPANLDGILLVDEADAPAPVDCPAPTSG